MYDIALKNGLVIDPASGICSRLDMGVNGSRVACMSQKSLRGKTEYDCTGLVVSPGFVDVHAHEDAADPQGKINPTITTRLLRMGVTTFVGGQCGSGPADEEAYLSAYDAAGQPVNCALLTAHGALRRLAGAADKYAPVTGDQIVIMCNLLSQRLAAGSFGMSISPRYIPGIDRREMMALACVVRLHGGILASHVRQDCDGALDAIAEFIEVGRETGVRLQVSHIASIAGYGQMQQALAMLDAAAAEGIDVMADCYPYDAFCTTIGSTTYDGDFTARYGDITNIEITQGEYKGRIPSMEIFQKIRSQHPEYLAIGHVMRPREVEMALTHPKVILGSDGVLANGAGHPRAAGAFSRFLRKYVAEEKALSLYEAIGKMTWTGAARFGLKKCCLMPGWDADIAVFDPERVTDNATFDQSELPSEGFRYIFIGGSLAVENDCIINPHLGRAIKKAR